MAKTKISEYDASAGNNTDVNSVNIAEGCAPSGINNAIREVMAALKRFETGADGDSMTVGGNLVVSGTATLSTTTIGPVNGTTIPSSKTLLVSTDIGSTVQGYDAQLADIAGLTPTDNGVIIGNGTNFVVESGATLKTSLGLTIGTDVQAYDADTAKTDTAQTFTASQRGTVTTDNDGSFSMTATNNFKCTPTGNFTLTFTNITAGQSGNIWLDNSGGYTVSAHSAVYISATTLAAISVAGVYWLSYYSPDGTNVAVAATGALT